VIAAALVGLLVVLLTGTADGGATVTALPAAEPTPAPAAAATSPAAKVTSPAPASPSPSKAAGSKPTASAAAPRKASKAAPRKAAASKAAPRKAAASKATPRKAVPRKAAPRKAAPPPPACAPDQLRATLTGQRNIKTNRRTTFALSLINGSPATCVVRVTADNFELKVYSGTDRIWSTRDCTRAVKTVRKAVVPEGAVEWKMTWDGNRSRKNCKDRPEEPQAGTYSATAQLDGAKPVRLWIMLRG
jgi:hypothetical protein